MRKPTTMRAGAVAKAGMAMKNGDRNRERRKSTDTVTAVSPVRPPSATPAALSTKVVDENLVVVDSIKLESYKTKAVVEMLKALGAEGKALIVTAESDKTVVKSAANIPGVKTATVNTLSVYDILNYDKFIVSSEAVKKIEEVYA